MNSPLEDQYVAQRGYKHGRYHLQQGHQLLFKPRDWGNGHELGRPKPAAPLHGSSALRVDHQVR